MIAGVRRSRMLAPTIVLAILAILTGGLMAQRAWAADEQWLQTSGGTIVTEAGDTFTIKSVSWFGLETPNCAPHGLWTIPLDDGMRQIASMGFNTIRVPFSNECLAAAASTSIDVNANPTLISLTPLELLDAVIASADAAGLRVILDRHRPESAGQSQLWYTAAVDENRWISDWQMLAARYLDDPTVIGADLHNEPHGDACWGCGDPARDWQAAATRAGNAVLAINPNWLIIVEGVEAQPDGTWTWWGGGLVGVAEAPVVLDVPNRVVYSPHDYPASVYAQQWFTAPDYPANLEPLWEKNWGYIATNGIAPVLLGEFGTTLATDSDRRWLTTLVDYLERTGISFSYWSFNPNSGDTGGLVTDDWRTPQQAKLDLLLPILQPGAAPTPSPSVTPTPTPTPKPTLTPKPVPTPPGWEPLPTPTASPTPSSMPRPSASPAPSATPTAQPVPDVTGAVSAQWMLQSSWGEGYVADILVTATSAIDGWRVSWPSPGATSVANSWGMTCSLDDGIITCDATDWAASLAAGGSVRVGLQVMSTTTPSAPVVEISAG